MKCCLFSRAVLPTDDPTTAFRKKVFISSLLAGAAIYLLNILSGSESSIVFWRRLSYIVVSLGVACQIILERRLRSLVIHTTTVFYGTMFLFGDLMAFAEGYARMWPFFIVLIDICLVTRMGNHVTMSLLVMLVLYLAVLLFENTYRFGLYDLSFLASQEERRKVVDCSSLPCPMELSTSIQLFLSQVFVFLLDFYFTRSFANGLHAEHDKMNKVIAATEQIATSFSRFDLEAAEAVIDSASLPPPLLLSFSKILENLKGYRPYLPDALFHSMHTEALANFDIPAPGLKSHRSTLVFTDIQGSTATWEACPEGMRDGLQVHNTAIRGCIVDHSGYEVKTIGDAFMVAFESASDAVWFGLSVQERLVGSSWPEELLCLESCSWQQEGPWCGLRVRVGIHCGEVEVQLNNLTNRYDYFGSTVNKAARMEGACVGGAVAVTSEVLEAVAPLDLICVIPMGEVELKGVSDLVSPFLLLPESLCGRKPFMEQQLLLKCEDRRLATMNFTGAESHSSHTSELMSSHMQQRPSATVGRVVIALKSYIDGVEATMNNGLLKVLTCTERSHGSVLSLQGNRVGVCWNGLKSCATHVENSLAFVKMLGRADPCFHIGLSTGAILHGTVGARAQKFMSVLGACVAVGDTLCDDAVSDGVLCYYAARNEPAEMDELSITSKGTVLAPDDCLMQLRRVELVTASQTVLGFEEA